MIFRLGGVQYVWAHPQLEEGVATHGVLPNQQMKPALAGAALITSRGIFSMQICTGLPESNGSAVRTAGMAQRSPG